MTATGRTVPTADLVRDVPSKRFEKAGADVEEHRQAKRRRAEERLKKCVADEDYQGAADAQADITALTSTGHGSRADTGHAVLSASGARGATAMRAEEVDEEVENRQAKPRCARDELSKCLADENYQGAAIAKGIIAELTSAAHGSRSGPGLSGSLAIGVKGAAAMSVERDHLKTEKRQAQLRHARAQLKKRLEVLDYR